MLAIFTHFLQGVVRILVCAYDGVSCFNTSKNVGINRLCEVGVYGREIMPLRNGGAIP
ncbi:MAG: hypothetical protein ACRC46_03335 [Thermoguttaceae bacterium]